MKKEGLERKLLEERVSIIDNFKKSHLYGHQEDMGAIRTWANALYNTVK